MKFCTPEEEKKDGVKAYRCHIYSDSNESIEEIQKHVSMKLYCNGTPKSNNQAKLNMIKNQGTKKSQPIFASFYDDGIESGYGVSKITMINIDEER